MAAQASTDPEDDDFFFGDDGGDSEDHHDSGADGAAPTARRKGRRKAKRRDGEHRAKPASARERFATWRKQRPFLPGLLVVLSGVVMLAPAYFTIRVSDLLVMIATISGVSTLLIGAALIMFGIGIWLQPFAAPYLGVMSILVAIIALPTSNLGGFVVGSLLGIIGGALGLAWEDADATPKGRHARGGKREQAPPDSEHEDPAVPGGGETPRSGGSTKIDLTSLRNAKTVAIAIAASGLIVANMGEEPAVNAQETVPQQLQIPALPELLSVPTLPQLPSLPSLPNPPEIKLPPAPQLRSVPAPQPPDPRNLLAYPELEPTRTIAPQNLSTVTADNVAISGNVRATMGMVTIGDVPTRTLILTGDRLTARNLALEVPGFSARGLLTTGPVETKVYDGPVTVVATGLTATPVVAGLPTVPVTVDLQGSLGDILAQLGVPDAHPVPNVPVPNFVMDRISLGGVTMQMVSLDGLHLHAPAVQLRVPK